MDLLYVAGLVLLGIFLFIAGRKIYFSVLMENFQKIGNFMPIEEFINRLVVKGYNIYRFKDKTMDAMETDCFNTNPTETELKNIAEIAERRRRVQLSLDEIHSLRLRYSGIEPIIGNRYIKITEIELDKLVSKGMLVRWLGARFSGYTDVIRIKVYAFPENLNYTRTRLANCP